MTPPVDLRAEPRERFRSLVTDAGLVMEGPVRGADALLPTGTAMWSLVKDELDRRLQTIGAEPVVLPAVGPITSVGLPPDATDAHDVARITQIGSRTLAEPLRLRSVADHAAQPFLQSWMQRGPELPVVWNQWLQAVRWEPRPLPLIRSVTFEAQEGISAHDRADDAIDMVRRVAYEAYSDLLHNVAAVPVDIVRVIEQRRALGARASIACEAELGDGSMVVVGALHDLGQRLSAVYDISVELPDGTHEYAWQTTWNLTSRVLGAIAVVHADADGLVLPPRVAPIQVEIDAVADAVAVAELVEQLDRAGVRAAAGTPFGPDDAAGRHSWRVRGVPFMVELAEGGDAVVHARTGGSAPLRMATADLATVLPTELTRMQAELLQRATSGREQRTVDAVALDDIVDAATAAVVRVPWAALDAAAVDRLGSAGVTVRGLIRPGGSLPDREDEPDLLALCARSW